MHILLALFLTAPLVPAGRSSQDRAAAAPAVKKMPVAGTTITYLEQGTGTPVVFVHGAFSDHRTWEPQREPVAKRYRFIAIDQRYFGAAARLLAQERRGRGDRRRASRLVRGES